MKTLIDSYYRLAAALGRIVQPVDGIPSLLLRLYLVPVFLYAGMNKLNWGSESGLAALTVNPNVIGWFEHSLELPFPTLMAYLAAYTEFFGALLLLIGLATRWISIPLMVTMIVAAVSVHLKNGWLAIASDSGFWATERTMEATERLDEARSILQEHGNYEWLTEHGSIVMLNNGIEFAATYFIMLLALLKLGGGRYVSVDYWLSVWTKRQ